MAALYMTDYKQVPHGYFTYRVIHRFHLVCLNDAGTFTNGHDRFICALESLRVFMTDKCTCSLFWQSNKALPNEVHSWVKQELAAPENRWCDTMEAVNDRFPAVLAALKHFCWRWESTKGADNWWDCSAWLKSSCNYVWRRLNLPRRFAHCQPLQVLWGQAPLDSDGKARCWSDPRDYRSKVSSSRLFLLEASQAREEPKETWSHSFVLPGEFAFYKVETELGQLS